MNRTQDPSPATGNSSEFPTRDNSIREIARFLCVVRARKEIVVMSFVVSCLLGGLYYVTAPRIFKSEASLLVMQPGGHTRTTEMSGERIARDLMPTYTSLLSSEAVLKDAVKGLAPEHRGDLADAPREQWPKVLGENLSTNARRGTNILDIRYLSRDPETAAAVVDAVLTSYVDFMNKLHQDASRDILDNLTREKKELEERIFAKQQQLLVVRRTVDELAITEGDTGVNVVQRRALTLNESLIEAHGQRIQAESNLRALEGAIVRGEDLQQYVLSMDPTVGHQVMLAQFGLGSTDAMTLSQINRQLIDDKAKLQSLLQTYGVQNQRVREVQNRIDVTGQFLQNRSQVESMQFRRMSSEQIKPALLQSAHQKLQMAAQLEESILASYEAEKSHALALDQSATELKMAGDDLERLQLSYDVILKRMTDIDSGQGSGGLRTSVTSEPKVSLNPVSPSLGKVVLLSCLLGALAGLAIVYLRDLLDDRFRSPEDLQEQTGVPVLAMIRKLEPLEEGAGAENIHVHVRQSGSDAESFRTLRTALAFAQGGVQRLVISSTEPGDGKTTVTVNLAAAIAQFGHKTLLIDADMRRPGTTPLLGLRGQAGLSTILRETAPVAESARANTQVSLIENLDVIPSGLRPVNPMELLASNRFADLLAWAEVEYEQIVVDSPPALAVSDSAIIGRLVDGVILIVRPEKNRRRMVVRAIESYPSLGVNVLGTVINHIDSEKNTDYYGYGYGYGYGYSYGHDESAEEPLVVDQPGLLPRRVDRDAA
jgi:polysaccharide biosynthesis transport protein